MCKNIFMKNRAIILSILGFFFFGMLIACSDESDNDQEPGEGIKPTISCTDPIEVSAAEGAETITVTYDAPTALLNNEPIATTQITGLSSGSEFPIGVTKNTFSATDGEGNTVTCSFTVTVNATVISEPSDEQPYAFQNGVKAPEGKKWVKVEELSDEFNGAEFDDDKWHRDPANDGFGWYGRSPALFESANVTVSDGNMNVTTLKYDVPKVVEGKSWTHGGAIVRSKAQAGHGKYYECRMKANKTIMSSTFWIAMQQNCNNEEKRKLELDIQECVGRVHEGTHTWAQHWDKIFHSNAIRHYRECDTEEDQETRASGVKNLDESNHDRFFVYGCWWKSPTEILFYLDGEYVYSITPTTDFDIDGYITMAIETYDWNPVDEAGSIFETGSFDDLTTKYDWVRTWELTDE